MCQQRGEEGGVWLLHPNRDDGTWSLQKHASIDYSTLKLLQDILQMHQEILR